MGDLWGSFLSSWDLQVFWLDSSEHKNNWDWVWQSPLYFIQMNKWQNFKEMVFFLRQYHRRFCHYFQDLLSKVDIHEDIWGPGHGVNNLTGNTQLALTSRGPHQMSFHIISSLGVWEAYISQIFSSDQELRKSLSPSMDGSVIFVNSSLNLHAVSQLPLSCLSPASDSCLSAASHQSLRTLPALSLGPGKNTEG